MIRGDAAGSIVGTQWDDIKETYADRVIGIIERYAPGFASKILARVVHSPVDLERDNPNLVGGDSLERQSSSRPEFFLPAGVRLVALSYADRASLYGRRVDLAGRRHQPRLGLHAGKIARRCLSTAAAGVNSAP